MKSELVVKFAELFLGRLDAFGTEEGGCLRPTDTLWVSYLDRIRSHLTDGPPMGVYPMDRIGDDWRVNWGCVDFDEGEETAWTEARNLSAVLGELGISHWVERSRSKGYHVWVFATGPTRASRFRRTLLGATQIAQASTKEINPKQEQMVEGQLGNYVRLPYPNTFGSGDTDRRVVVDPHGNPYLFETFVEQAHATRNAPALFEQYQTLWKPPKKNHLPQRVTVNADELGELPDIHGMSKRTHHAFAYGPFEDSDRSSFLFRLGLYLVEDGFTPDQALALLVNADERWGKFMARGDVHEIEKIVTKVFS